MADYTAGNLNLEIMGVNDSAVKSISAVVKSLNSLSNALSKINATQTVLAGNQLTLLFEKMGKAASSMDSSKIANFASAAKSLNSISRIGNLEKVDLGKVAAGFNNLTVAITPFVNKVKEAEASLTALYGILSKSSGKKIQGLLDGKGKKGGFSFLNVAKWGTVIYSARRLGRLVGEVAQAGADYTETLNLWETAMGNNLSVATEFVKKMNEAYGVSEKTLMNAQAIFKNMLGSLGQISDQMAYALSEGVTQMALDYASLYNQTFEQAFTKFQAALAGQVRPIRSVAGYDITENTLYQLYQSLGGEKTMRQLSRTEKQLLSILAIFNQMSASGAVGDLNKTMESFANQSRVMAEAWQRVLTYSGTLLTHFIESTGAMTYINAILIFVGDTLKAVADNMGAITSFADPFESTTEGALNATDAIDKMQGKLLGFDKIRALNETEEDNVNLDTQILEEFVGFDTILANANMEAQGIAEKLKEASGLFNEDGTFNPDAWDEMIENVKLFGSVLLGIGSVLTFQKISNAIPKLTKSFAQMETSLKKAFSLKNIGIMALIAAIYYAYTTNDEFRESVDLLLQTLGEALGTVIQPISDIINAIAPIIGEIVTEVAELVAPLITLVANVINFLSESGGLVPLLLGIVSAIVAWNVAQAINNALMLSSPTTWIILGIVAAVGLLVAAIGLAITYWDEIVAAFETGWNWLKENVFIPIGNFFVDIINNMIGAVEEFVNFFIRGINAIINALNKISFDIPDWVPVIGGGKWGFNLRTVPEVSWGRIPRFAEGGLPDRGSLFVAGEAGAEMVYNMPSGQSGVANIQQIKSAFYQALVEYGRTQNGDDRPIEVYLDGEKVYESTTAHAKRRGNVWSKS